MDDQHSDILAPEKRGRNRTASPAATRAILVAEPREAETRPRRRSGLRVLLWLLLLAAIVGAAVVYLPRLAHKPSPGGRGRVTSGGADPGRGRDRAERRHAGHV